MTQFTINDLVGKTFSKVVVNEYKTDMMFSNDEYWFQFYHQPECCECVSIEEIIGDLNDLIDTPILEAREDVSDVPDDLKRDDTNQWTFYNFRTIKGSVTVRWFGSSNGWYSVAVDFRGHKKG